MKEKYINKKLLLISSILIFCSYLFVVIRYFYPSLLFLYSFIDGYWVFTSTIFLASIVWNRKLKYYIIIFIPFCLGFIDELFQYNNFIFEKLGYSNNLWTRTFDIYDLIAYTMGLVIALFVIVILKKLKRPLRT